MKKKNKCSIAECENIARAKALCDKHYRRYLTHGNPAVTRRPGLGKTAKERLDMYTDKSGDCWIFTADKSKIYGRVGKNLAHRLAYELNYGEIPDGHIVRHKCDIPRCVRPDHLEVGTHADNSKDMTDRARQAYGERQGSSKLKEADVLQIRKLYSDSQVKVRDIAEAFGIGATTVSEVATGKKWPHLPGKCPKRAMRISDDARKDVLSRLALGQKHREIAAHHGVSRAAISKINSKRKQAI